MSSFLGRRETIGAADERDLFPHAIRLVDEARPKAVMIENVNGLLAANFAEYRVHIVRQLEKLGYRAEWRRVIAADFGVPQFRPRVVLVVIRHGLAHKFSWPVPDGQSPPTVGETRYDRMVFRGWSGAVEWKLRANTIAPTIVGGSRKHGGPDLGSVRARKAWEALSVDGRGVADDPPPADFAGMPKLTVRMVARLQGFSDSWGFVGGKTTAYRQVANAFPPPVAQAVAEQISTCLTTRK